MVAMFSTDAMASLPVLFSLCSLLFGHSISEGILRENGPSRARRQSLLASPIYVDIPLHLMSGSETRIRVPEQQFDSFLFSLCHKEDVSFIISLNETYVATFSIENLEQPDENGRFSFGTCPDFSYTIGAKQIQWKSCRLFSPSSIHDSEDCRTIYTAANNMCGVSSQSIFLGSTYTLEIQHHDRQLDVKYCSYKKYNSITHEDNFGREMGTSDTVSSTPLPGAGINQSTKEFDTKKVVIVCVVMGCLAITGVMAVVFAVLYKRRQAKQIDARRNENVARTIFNVPDGPQNGHTGDGQTKRGRDHHQHRSRGGDGEAANGQGRNERDNRRGAEKYDERRGQVSLDTDNQPQSGQKPGGDPRAGQRNDGDSLTGQVQPGHGQEPSHYDYIGEDQISDDGYIDVTEPPFYYEV